ncbi:MAG: hypothetical protein ACXU87_22555, partial [Xanthobacteraceae bacterium]
LCLVEIGCFRHGGVHDPTSLDLPHNSFIRLHDAEIKLPFGSDQNHSLTCHDDHRDVMRFTGYGPFAYFAPLGLLAPGIGKAGVTPDFNSVFRCRQDKPGFARPPVVVQQVIHQPKAAEAPALARPVGINLATAPRLAVRAPRPHGLRQLFNRHHLAAKGAVSARLPQR